MSSGKIFEKLDYAEYDALPCMRFSLIKWLLRSPMAFQFHRDHPIPPTAPMILGLHAHKAILEPELQKFAVWPGPGIRAGHKYTDWCAENQGKVLLSAREESYIIGMRDAVHANPSAHRYLRHAKTEVSIVWRDPSFNRDMKIRPDAIIDIDDEPVMVSLKSAADIRADKFGMAYYRLAYHVQDALYQAGYFYVTSQLPRMVLIAVESLPPHETAVFNVPMDVLRLGQQDLSRCLERLAECEKTNHWPPAIEGETDLVLPHWAFQEHGDFDFADLEPIG